MTLVKICGITSAEDLEAAVDAGADALGFNFWPRSPRFITMDAAAELVRAVPEGVLKVGVFVDTSAGEMERTAAELNLDIIQLHGAADRTPGVRFWQAVSAGTEGWRETMESSRAEAFLVDTPAGKERGGTGRTFDWSLLDGVTQRIVLAGGLGPDNVAEAVRRVRPWGVDACSRLESAPGRKDAARMRAFVQAVRETGL